MPSSPPGQNRGTRNRHNKLREEDVRAIFSDTTHKQWQLALRYSVSQSLISRIKTQEVWSWLDKDQR